MIAPQKIQDTLGADILRLWVAAHRLFRRDDHLRRDPQARGGKLPAHPQHLRFLLANTADFESETRDALPVGQWLEIDRYALATVTAIAG